MTSFERCLDTKVKLRRLDRQTADKVKADVASLEAAYLRDSDAAVAKARAALKVAGALEADAALRKYQTALQIQKQRGITTYVENHPVSARRGAIALLDRDLSDEGGTSNVWGRQRAVLGQAHALFVDGIERLRPKTGGWSLDTAGLRNFVHALYGGQALDTGIAGAIQGWQRATQMLGSRWRASGGLLRGKSDWRLPNPAHDRERILRAKEPAWTQFMQDALVKGDLRMVDFESGLPLSKSTRVAEILADAYRSITTGGLSDIVPGAPVGGKLANARADHRVFEWTSADAWLAYNDRFGAGDVGIWDALTGHLGKLSRDIAMIEILGPNPAHSVALIAGMVERANDKSGGVAVRRLWNVLSGAISQPVHERTAKIMSEVRAGLTAAQLGGAVLGVPSDFAAMASTARWNALPATRIMNRYLRLLRSSGDQAMAVRLGLIADSWTGFAINAMRDWNDAVKSGMMSVAADRVLRASGLTLHTQALQHAFGMEVLGHLADLAGKRLDQLPSALQAAFRRYDIDAGRWDRARQAVLTTPEGARFLDPIAMAEAGGASLDAASRIQEMIAVETRFAVPMPGPLERSTYLDTRPGTFSGELVRSLMQYKGFGLSIVMTHGVRGWNAMRRGGDKGAYLAGFFIAMTIGGALSMQLKETAKGRDPRDMTDPRFWAAAALQGGALGIFGDFLYGPTARNSQDLIATLSGPVIGVGATAAVTTLGNLYQFGEGQDTNAGRELVNLARRYTPGTSLWYARLALDRMLWDQLQEMADPAAGRAFRRVEREARKQYGQDFWWGPGDLYPRTVANPMAAVGRSR